MDDEKQMDRVQKIPLTELVPFKDHPFKVVEDESMLRTTESISMFGVLTPLIARPIRQYKYARRIVQLLVGLYMLSFWHPRNRPMPNIGR